MNGRVSILKKELVLAPDDIRNAVYLEISAEKETALTQLFRFFSF